MRRAIKKWWTSATSTSLDSEALLFRGGRLVIWQGNETSFLLAPMLLNSKPSCNQQWTLRPYSYHTCMISFLSVEHFVREENHFPSVHTEIASQIDLKSDSSVILPFSQEPSSILDNPKWLLLEELIGTQLRTPLLYRNVSYWPCRHLNHLIHFTFTRLTRLFFFSTLFKQQRRRTWKIQVTTRFKRCPLRYRHTTSLIRPCNLELVIKWDHDKNLTMARQLESITYYDNMKIAQLRLFCSLFSEHRKINSWIRTNIFRAWCLIFFS